MEVSAATRAAPGSRNDDSFLTGPDFAAVLDGATAPPGRDSGCVHDVPWLVARLSGHLGTLLRQRTAPLTEILACAIRRLRDDHADDCDLSNPDSPSCTVTVVRRADAGLDYLVLGDSPLLLRDVEGAVDTIVDDRVDRLPSYTYDAVAALRNSPDGFWVASTNPAAARHAHTGTVPLERVDRALLLTDGVSRLATRHGRDWPKLLELADSRGPLALIDAAHAADAAAEPGRFRGKRFDDATAVLCRPR